MSVKWTEDLSVGVDLIDDQHKMMFEKASELFEGWKRKKSTGIHRAPDRILG